jgi:hypothetical protein
MCAKVCAVTGRTKKQGTKRQHAAKGKMKGDNILRSVLEKEAVQASFSNSFCLRVLSSACPILRVGQLLLRRYQRLAILRVVGTLLFQIYDLLLSRCPRLC